jgi:hypothetical protein
LLGFRFPELKAVIVEAQNAAGVRKRSVKPVFQGTGADGVSTSVAGVARPGPNVEPIDVPAWQLTQCDAIPNPMQKWRDFVHATSLLVLL